MALGAYLAMKQFTAPKVNPALKAAQNLSESMQLVLDFEKNHDERRAMLKDSGLMPLALGLGEVGSFVGSHFGAPSPEQVLKLFNRETDPETASLFIEAENMVGGSSSTPFSESKADYLSNRLKQRVAFLADQVQRCVVNMIIGLEIILFLLGAAAYLGRHMLVAYAERRHPDGVWKPCAGIKVSIKGEPEDSRHWGPNPPLCPLPVLLANRKWQSIPKQDQSSTARWLMRLLLSFKEYPASSGQYAHDSHPGGLIDHSFHVLSKILELNNNQFDPKALVVVSLAHDLGKLVTMVKVKPKKKGAVHWVHSGEHHDRFSAHLLYFCPHLTRDFGPELAAAMHLAVRYHHEPTDLPLGASEMTRSLLSLLTKADRQAASSASRDQNALVSPELDPTLLAAIVPNLLADILEADCVIDAPAGIAWVTERRLRELAAKTSRGKAQDLLLDEGQSRKSWAQLREALLLKGALGSADLPQDAPLDLYTVEHTGASEAAVLSPFRVPLLISMLNEAANWPPDNVVKVYPTLDESDAPDQLIDKDAR